VLRVKGKSNEDVIVQVLETGETLNEITNLANFHVDKPTLNVGAVCNNTRLIQINFTGIFFLKGGTNTSVNVRA